MKYFIRFIFLSVIFLSCKTTNSNSDIDGSYRMSIKNNSQWFPTNNLCELKSGKSYQQKRDGSQCIGYFQSIDNETIDIVFDETDKVSFQLKIIRDENNKIIRLTDYEYYDLLKVP